MDSFPAQRYQSKIENFDTCVKLDAESQEQEASNSENMQTPPQLISTEKRENNEVTTLQQYSQDQHMPDQSNQILQNQQTSQQNITLTPIRLPAILDGEFFTVMRVLDTNVTVKCLQCQKLLNGNLKSTGNFLSHIKRIHPLMIDKIKCKSNQRKPAMIYVDLSADKCSEIIRMKRDYKKCHKPETIQVGNEETFEDPTEWGETPIIRRKKYDETETNGILKNSQNNSFVAEDEFDAIGRNVAAKLRNMRLDQRIIAEKLLNDILFEAQLGNLHRDSNIHV